MNGLQYNSIDFTEYTNEYLANPSNEPCMAVVQKKTSGENFDNAADKTRMPSTYSEIYAK